MKTLFRVLGAAAAVAATGAAIVVLDKVLNDKGPLHVEEVEFPEEAEKDPAEAAKQPKPTPKARPRPLSRATHGPRPSRRHPRKRHLKSRRLPLHSRRRPRKSLWPRKHP